MAEIIIADELNNHESSQKFLFLGDQEFIKHTDNRKFVNEKISKTNKETKHEFWGTLGNFDKSRINWTGKLYHSRIGNFDSTGITQELKQDLIEATGTNDLSHSDIRERYISFDEINFPEDLRENNALRLTLFLNNDEGALVYYQHFDNDESDFTLEKHVGFDYDFIHPEATKNDVGLVDFNTSNRDRLNYEIDILPKQITTEDIDPDIIKKLRFVIKILTFKRKSNTNENIIKRSEEKLFNSNERYKLMVFDKIKDEFVTPDSLTNRIDSNEKTLFLIHGTFVDTLKSYDAILTKSDGNPSILKQYLEDKITSHNQAIAFNHPTMFDDAQENTMWLMKELDKYQFGFAFSKTLDLVGTSRGALLGKYLAIEFEKNQGNNPKIPVGKIVTVSGANGCGYLTKGKQYVNTILKLLKKGSPVQKVFVSLGQLSVLYITTRSGLQLMTPGNKKLTEILNYNPPATSKINVLTLAADFDIKKSKKIGKKIKNFFIRIGDITVQKMLGKQHDFVIGTIEQQITEPFPAAHVTNNKVFNAIHGQVLDKKVAWNLIVRYLNS